MIALDHGDGAAGPQQPLENRGKAWAEPREVLQDKADEDVVEGLGIEGQGEDVCSWNSTLVSPARSARRLASAIESAEISTDVKFASWLRWAKVTVSAPTPHPTSSTLLPPG